MQINILQIAQQLLNELGIQEESMRLRAEGVALLFEKIREAHEAATLSEAAPQIIDAQEVVDV